MDYETFKSSGCVVEVFSELLGEEILFAANNADVPFGEERVVYRSEELKKMLNSGIGREEIKALHLVKKNFGGKTRIVQVNEIF